MMGQIKFPVDGELITINTWDNSPYTVNNFDNSLITVNKWDNEKWEGL